MRALLVVAAMGVATPAAAWRLDVEGAACGEAASLRERVEAQRSAPGREVEVTAAARVTQEEGRWRLVLTIARAGATPVTRELEGESCVAVVDAAALILSLALDAAPAPPAPPPPPRVALRRRSGDAVDDVEPRRPPAPRMHLELAAALGGEVGALPAPSGTLRVEVRGHVGPVVVGLGAAGWIPRTERDEAGEGVSASLWAGRVVVGVRPWPWLTASGVLELGLLAAEAVGVPQRRAITAQWQAAGGGLAVRRALSPGLRLEVAVELARALNQPTFLVDGEARYTPGWQARMWAGVGWEIW